MTAERKHESAGFVIGVILLFSFVMSIELLVSETKPLLQLQAHIAFTLVRALLANIFLLIITRRINIKLDDYFPWYPNALKRLIIQGLLTILISAVIISVIVGLMINSVVPYSNNAVALQRSLIFSNISAIVLSILYTGVYFFNQWGRSLVDLERLKREQLQSQFAVLKQQLNPHFLFNSFSTLTSLLQEDSQHATEFVQKLSNVYRYVLQSSDRNTIELNTEIQAVQAYAFLQQTRFGNNLRVEIDVPTVYRNLFIAPLTLQILLENAIKHNVVSSERPLTVKILIIDEEYIAVKNNLQKKNSIEAGTQVGLKNIQSRYEILSEKKVDIMELDSEFIVSVPLLKDELR